MSLWSKFIKEVRKSADKNGIGAFVVAGYEDANQKTGVSTGTAESGHESLMKLSSCCVAFEQFVESLKAGAPTALEPESAPSSEQKK